MPKQIETHYQNSTSCGFRTIEKKENTRDVSTTKTIITSKPLMKHVPRSVTHQYKSKMPYRSVKVKREEKSK